MNYYSLGYRVQFLYKTIGKLESQLFFAKIQLFFV